MERREYGVTYGGYKDEIDSIRIIPGTESSEEDSCPPVGLVPFLTPISN
jgi:hypothetical protein